MKYESKNPIEIYEYALIKYVSGFAKGCIGFNAEGSGFVRGPHTANDPWYPMTNVNKRGLTI